MPLIDVPVPVAHQDVDEPRTQVRAGIDPLIAAAIEQLEQVRGGEILVAPRDVALDALLEDPQHPADLAEGMQTGIARQHGQLRNGMENSHRVHQRCDDQRAARMRGTRQVLEDVADDALPRIRVEDAGGILVHRPPHPAVPASALEMHAGRLQSAAEALGRQAAVEGVEIEDGSVDRGRPRVAPLRAEEKAIDPVGAILRPGRHGNADQCKRRDEGRHWYSARC